MGLNTSHDCWIGAYGAFQRWRMLIAEVAGFCVWKVQFDGDFPPIPTETVMLEWHRIGDDELMGIWKEPAPHPMYYFIGHSDCEGKIYPKEAVEIADMLEGLLPELSKQKEIGGHIGARGGIVAVTEKFIAGLRDAASKNEPVDFH